MAFPLFTLACLLLLFLFSSCWWDVMGMVSDTTRRQGLTEKSQILWLLHSFCTLFLKCPRALDSGVILCMCPLGVGSTTLHFCGFLYWFPSVAKRHFLDEGWVQHLPVDRKTNTQNVVRNCLQTCNANTWEDKASGSWVWDQPGLYSKGLWQTTNKYIIFNVFNY